MRLSQLVAVVVVSLWIGGRAQAAPGCTTSADCSASVPVCNAGSACELCSASNNGEAECQASHGGTHCDTSSGACVECNLDSDCPSSKPACTLHVCGPCAADATCSVGHGGTHCETAAGAQQGHCVACRSGNSSADCTSASAPVCTNNVCGACSGAAGETVCMTNQGGKHCETAAGALQGQCVICRSSNSSADCAAAAPVCVSGACTGCTPTDPAPSGQCSRFGASTVCTAGGACVQCTTDVSCPLASAPHCVSNVCGACDATGGTHGDESCAHFADGGVPACQPNDGIATSAGSCKQCSVNNTSACTGSTPACNFVSGACQLCTVTLGDLGGVSTGCAADPNGHACQGSGSSVFCGCTSDADCGGPTSGRVCDTILSRCAAGCSRAPSRNHCPAGQFCTTNDITGAAIGVCTTSCNYDVDCNAGMPFCVAPDGDAGVGRCAGCRTNADCSGVTPLCESTRKVCVQCETDADCGDGYCDPMHACVLPATGDLAVVVDGGEPSDLAVPHAPADDDGCSMGGARPTATGTLILLALSLAAASLGRGRRKRNPRT